MISFSLIAFVIIPAVIVVFLAMFVSKQYKRCPSNKVLVIYGSKSKDGKSAKCLHGGGAFVIPLLQDYQYMSLEPMSLEVDLKEALSKNNIRVNVPSTFTVGISPQEELLENAAQRLLGMSIEEIQEQAKDIALGQLRLVIASMTIEEINQDREKFQKEINSNVAEELTKIGLQVINVNIRDITDESGYIEAIGQKAAATAKQQALIDVAEQTKKGSIGRAEAEREQKIEVAKAEAAAVKGEKEADTDKSVRVAELDATRVEGENKSKAHIADYNAELAVKEANAMKKGEVAKAEAEKLVLEKEKEAEIARLEKLELAQKEVDKKKVEVEADADAERIRRVAKGEADAILAKAEAEAKGIKAVLDAKAQGYKALVESCGNNPDLAAKLLVIEKMEQIVEKQMDALKNVKIDKLTVWDGGSSSKGGAGLKSFLNDYITSTPAMADLAAQVGIEIPKFMGQKLPIQDVQTSKTQKTEATTEEVK